MRLRVMVTQAHFAYLVSARGAGVVPMMAGSKAPGLSDALARVYEVGPIIWAKRAAGASVPWRERIAGSWWPRSISSCPRPMTATWCSLSIGSQFTVLSSTYYPMVFVVDRDSLWMLPPVLQHAKAELCPGCPGTVLRRRRAAGAPDRDAGENSDLHRLSGDGRPEAGN